MSIIQRVSVRAQCASCDGVTVNKVGQVILGDCQQCKGLGQLLSTTRTERDGDAEYVSMESRPFTDTLVTVCVQWIQQRVSQKLATEATKGAIH